MTTPIAISFVETDLDALAAATGKLALIVTPDGKLDPAARRVNRLAKGAVARLIESDRWGKAEAGDCVTLAFPAGLAAEALIVVKLARRPEPATARKAGGALAKAKGEAELTLTAGALTRTADLALGLALRGYDFSDHKTDEDKPLGDAVIMASKPDEVAAAAAPLLAAAEGVFLTRTLVNEPSNILTTEEFAARLAAMRDLGLEVEVLDEAELEALGMRDETFGWTVEMQVRAARAGLRCAEVPVAYRKRVGKSKITGTVNGTVRAGAKILWTVGAHALRGPLLGDGGRGTGDDGPRTPVR